MFKNYPSRLILPHFKRTYSIRDRCSSLRYVDTGIKIYNCKMKDKQPLILPENRILNWYTCGPTVYDSAHIGHASCYVKFDIIQRILRGHFNINLITVMNITDIDDKIISRSKIEQLEPDQIAKKYEREFWTDLDTLNIKHPNYVLRVTENVNLIIDFISKLINERFAYQAEDNSVYFDVTRYKLERVYGKLQNLGNTVPGKSKFKKSPHDFALWKSSQPGEKCWDSIWGPGRPGWHIECSALASHAFGSRIDIHAGGIDLKFPHHENEEAQSCAYHNCENWVSHWMHTGHLHLAHSDKMSKSLRNTIGIREMLEKTNAQVFRFACLMSHYRSNMEFSEDYMETAARSLQHYNNFLNTCQNYSKGYIKASICNETISEILSDGRERIEAFLADDFDTSAALRVLNEIISKVNNMLESNTFSNNYRPTSLVPIENYFANIFKLFGLEKSEMNRGSGSDFVNIMNVLNNFRQSIRQIGIRNKNIEILNLCDGVREDLKQQGVQIKDYGKLSSWS